MTNLYTGRSEHELMKITVAEYRFYRNSLRNFGQGNPATKVDDLGEYLETTDLSPRQGKALTLPSIDIEDEDAHFNFPANLEDYLKLEEAFTVEYFGVPAWRGDPDLITDVLALISDNDPENPRVIGWRPDGRIYVNLGAPANSDVRVWVFMDAPTHFIFTRETGAAANIAAYVNGSEVSWDTTVAGDGGFTDITSEIFNWDEPEIHRHACYGHHFFLRFYSDQLTAREAWWRYDQIQKLVAHEKFPIPAFEQQA